MRGHEFIEQRTEVDHRLTKVLGVGLPVLVARSDLATRAVVVDHVRVIDRQIVEPPVGVVHRVAAAAHHLTDEAIGLHDSRARLIHELRLHVRHAAVKRSASLAAVA